MTHTMLSTGGFHVDAAERDALYDDLAGLLAAVPDAGNTRPVSVTLPAPLADAFRLLSERGLVDNVSAATREALEGHLRSLMLRLRLDAMYERHPESRPSEEEVQAMATRLGIDL